MSSQRGLCGTLAGCQARVCPSEGVDLRAPTLRWCGMWRRVQLGYPCTHLLLLPVVHGQLGYVY